MTTQAGKPKMSNLLVRILTSVPLIIITLAAIWYGGYWFMGFCTLVGALVLYEWGLVTAARQNRLTRIASFVCYVATAVVLFVMAPVGLGAKIPVGAILTTMLVSLAVLAVLSRRNAGWVAGGYLYAAVFMLGLSLTRWNAHLFELERFLAVFFTFALFGIVWATDIGAYFCGRIIGGPKLAPRISPNKTWSGAIGGALITVIAMLLLWHLLSGRTGFLHWDRFDALVAGFSLLLSVISQLGDLGESWLKRHFGVKDSSNMLPGHGGIMDRVDGLIAVSAFAFILKLI